MAQITSPTLPVMHVVCSLASFSVSDMHASCGSGYRSCLHALTMVFKFLTFGLKKEPWLVNRIIHFIFLKFYDPFPEDVDFTNS